jgi:hypothetical protein
VQAYMDRVHLASLLWLDGFHEALGGVCSYAVP